MVRQLTLKYEGHCIDCGDPLSAGEKARWIRRGEITCADGEGCRVKPGFTTGLGDDQNGRGAERENSLRNPGKPADGSSWGDRKAHIAPIDKPKRSTTGIDYEAAAKMAPIATRVDQSVVNVLLNNLHALVGALKMLDVDITYRIGRQGETAGSHGEDS